MMRKYLHDYFITILICSVFILTHCYFTIEDVYAMAPDSLSLCESLDGGHIQRTTWRYNRTITPAGIYPVTGGWVTVVDTINDKVRIAGITVVGQPNLETLSWDANNPNVPFDQNLGKVIFELHSASQRWISVSSAGSQEMFNYIKSCKDHVGAGPRDTKTSIVITHGLINYLGSRT